MTAFERLAPFIQEFIYNSGWNELHDVQAEAIGAILDTSGHVLITSGTASGKTEAAFFPILTTLWREPASSFGVMYIGPLKALINDQFERISALTEEAGMPIYAWHGDRTAGEKARAVRQSRGILQITPESLEALMMNHPEQAGAMFGDLRFVVIDELHAFMGTDRGMQLQCLLARLSRLTGCAPRRVGLSATISDTCAAERWLAAGTRRETVVVASSAAGRKLNLSLRHDVMPRDEDGSEFGAARKARLEYLYGQVAGRKCLVFTNSRMEAENTAATLSALAEERGESDIFRVHHGSISAALRSETESALRGSSEPAVVVATKTLELGIDLGSLDRVAQLGAPNTCSSFVQRLGRSGRRGTPAVMRFLTSHRPQGDEPFCDLPWELIQNIAIIQLYLEDRWVEGFENKPRPFSLLFHQTLSHLMAHECTGRELARAVLTLPPFSGIAPEDYRALLDYMLESGMIEKTESGTLIPGLEGEKLAGNYRFYSVFEERGGYRVLFRQKLLGEIDDALAKGKVIALAGRTWRVENVDPEKRCIHVLPAQGEAKRQWQSGSGAVDDRIVMKMRDILLTDTAYAYLQKGAAEVLAAARAEARAYDLSAPYTARGDGRFLLHPWLGTRRLKTLEILLRGLLKETLDIRQVQALGLPGFIIATGFAPDEWLRRLGDALSTVTPEALMSAVPLEPCDRYDPHLPESLCRKSFVYNQMDLDGLRAWAGK